MGVCFVGSRKGAIGKCHQLCIPRQQGGPRSGHERRDTNIANPSQPLCSVSLCFNAQMTLMLMLNHQQCPAYCFCTVKQPPCSSKTSSVPATIRVASELSVALRTYKYHGTITTVSGALRIPVPRLSPGYCYVHWWYTSFHAPQKAITYTRTHPHTRAQWPTTLLRNRSRSPRMRTSPARPPRSRRTPVCCS